MQVHVPDHQICDRSRCDAAEPRPLSREPRGPLRVRRERNVKAHALWRHEGTTSITRTHTRHRRMKTVRGTRLLDRGVGTECEAGAAQQQALPWIRAIAATVPPTFDEVTIRSAMSRLHAGGDAERGKARQVVFGDELRMFYARWQIGTTGAGPCCGGKRIERRTHGPIPDRMDRHGKPARPGSTHDLLELFPRNQIHARIICAVVRLEHGRSARAERSVREQLQRTDAKTIVADTARESKRQSRLETCVRQAHEYAHARTVTARESTQRGHRMSTLEVVHGRDSFSE